MLSFLDDYLLTLYHASTSLYIRPTSIVSDSILDHYKTYVDLEASLSLQALPSHQGRAGSTYCAGCNQVTGFTPQ